jgi:hypothetical protein
MPLFNIDPGRFFDDHNIENMHLDDLSMLSWLDLGSFLSSIDLWLGLVVCGLFATAAIYVRRYRDDS